MDSNQIVNNIKESINLHESYCDGYKGKSYILGLSLGTGITRKLLSHPGSYNLDKINAFDKAEVDGPNLGQTNMITVSSFCGPQGIIWGYDIVKDENLYKPHPLVSTSLTYKNKTLNIFSAQSIINSTLCLLGDIKEKHFPIIPGAHIPCAGKHISAEGSLHIYSAIAIGIPSRRESDACLLIEDIGIFVDSKGEDNTNLRINKQITLINLAKSIIEIGINQNIDYKEVFLQIKDVYVNHGEIGCALVAAPYLTLPQHSLTENFEDLIHISTSEWKQRVFNNFICNNGN